MISRCLDQANSWQRCSIQATGSVRYRWACSTAACSPASRSKSASRAVQAIVKSTMPAPSGDQPWPMFSSQSCVL
jgi:hypothetical protein